MSRVTKKSQSLKQRATRIRRLATLVFAFFALTWGVVWFYAAEMDVKLSNWTDDQLLAFSSDIGLQVRDVLVEGVDNLDLATLKAVLNVEKGDPLFAFDPRATKALVERLAWVKEARVERRFPDTIYVHITERTPIALWKGKSGLRLIDGQGDVITADAPVRYKSLLVVEGADAPGNAKGLIESLKAQPQLWARTRSAAWVGQRRWDMMLDTGVSVKLPESNAAQALARLAEAQARDRLLDKKINAIDLREEGRIVIQTAPGQAMNYEAAMPKKGSAI